MAEPLEMPFGGGKTRVGPENHVLDKGVYGRHLANTVKRFVLFGNAGCCCHYCSNLLCECYCLWHCWL